MAIENIDELKGNAETETVDPPQPPAGPYTPVPEPDGPEPAPGTVEPAEPDVEPEADPDDE